MRVPIQRVDTYNVPASGSVAEDVETYVAQRVTEIVSGLPEDRVLEVSTIPRGDYVEVMIFAGMPETKARLEEYSEKLREELRARGVATAFYVKTWTGVA
jgi:folate-dependent tRNA-U54 methylase TrmFO/GidA